MRTPPVSCATAGSAGMSRALTSSGVKMRKALSPSDQWPVCAAPGKIELLKLGGQRQHLRHDGCGRRAGKVELMTGVDGASSRDVDGGMTMLTFLTLVVVVGTNITSQSQLYSDMAS